MARTKYTVTFPAAKAGDEVTWQNAVNVYPDANAVQPLVNGYIETVAGSFTGWSDATSVTFTRAGTDAVTVTATSPTGTGAAVIPSAAYLQVSEGPLGLSRYAAADGTDQSVGINAAITAIYNAGGGTLWVDGHYRADSQIAIPHDGNTSNPKSVSLRITGQGGSAALGSTPTATGKGSLDLRYAGADARIVALGQGNLEIDHIDLKSGAATSTPFILVTQATPQIHHATFIGTASKSLGTCDEDAVILGGTVAAYNNTTASGFGGYGGSILHCQFDHIRRAALLRVWCNSITVAYNWINSTCGSNLLTVHKGAIEIDTGGVGFARGNTILANTIEAGDGVTNGYTYGVTVNGAGADHNKILLNDIWDQVAGWTADVHLGNGANALQLGMGARTYDETTPGDNLVLNLADQTIKGWATFIAPGAAVTPLIAQGASAAGSGVGRFLGAGQQHGGHGWLRQLGASQEQPRRQRADHGGRGWRRSGAASSSHEVPTGQVVRWHDLRRPLLSGGLAKRHQNAGLRGTQFSRSEGGLPCP